jgi:hypothetical protein
VLKVLVTRPRRRALLAAAAALIAVPAASIAGPGPSPGRARLRLVSAGRTSLTLTVSAVDHAERRQGRSRIAGGHRHWGGPHTVAARWVLSGLRPGIAYELEVRACRVARCGPWSASLSASTVSAGPTGIPPASGAGKLGCPVFPADNAWNENVSKLPVDPRSAAYVASIGAAIDLHADFGSEPAYGIPYTVVGAAQPLVPIHFTAYGDQSDPGPYPIPADAPVEQGSDRHVIVVQNGTCKLFELYDAQPDGAGWDAASGAVFDLRSDRLRPDGWTSADAAGLPIFAGLVRYDEVASGRIDHALRFTVPRTQAGFIHPATHAASSSTDPDLPPMGLRLRLKASFPLGSFHGQALVILRALKTYGMIVADNGSSWYISGASDPRFDDDDLDQLKAVPGSAFEAVRTGAIVGG